jgi:vancomycin resistance protein YoaR
MADLNGGRDVQLNREAIKSWAAKLAKEVDQDPENARFSWTNGNLSLLRPSKDGRDLDVELMTEMVVAKAFEQDRAIVLPVNVTKPSVSQEDGPKLGIKGAIEVAKTSFAGASPPKQHNINLAAKNLNGVVVPPNQLFSFNKEVGSTSLDAGYKLGWGIANAGTNVKTVPSVAGGICQVSTTLFHAVFFAGYQIEERNYHLYWIPSYTTRGVEGLDATVDEEAKLDFRFYNNTEDYLLIQSWTEGSSVVFGLYGTKPDWTVKITPGERTDVVDASTDKITEEEPSLPLGQRLAVEGAMDGFKLVNVREVRHGSDVRPLRLASVYRPSRNVTLVGTGGRPARPSQVTGNQPTRSDDQGSRSVEATPAARTAATATPRSSNQSSQPAATPAASKPTAAPAAPTAQSIVPIAPPGPASKSVVVPSKPPGAPTPARLAPTPAAKR